MLIVLGLQMLIMAPIMAVWAICKIADKQWEWTMSTAAAVGVLLIVVLVALVLALPKFRKLQQLTDDLNVSPAKISLVCVWCAPYKRGGLSGAQVRSCQR